MINSKSKDENLGFYIKNIEKLMNIQRKSTNNSSMMRKFIRRKTTVISSSSKYVNHLVQDN